MATFLVTNTKNGGTGSLRDAISQAEANGSGTDTIKFAKSLKGDTIFLKKTLTIKAGNNLIIKGDLDGDGDPDIKISGDANKDGKVKAGDVGILLDIKAGADATIKSIHFMDGFSRGADGFYDYDTYIAHYPGDGLAGVRNQGTLNLTDSILSGLKAFGGVGLGAGFDPKGGHGYAGIINSGILTVSDTIVEQSKAKSGVSKSAAGSGSIGTPAAVGLITQEGTSTANRLGVFHNVVTGGKGGPGADGGTAVGAIYGAKYGPGGTTSGIAIYGNNNLIGGPGGPASDSDGYVPPGDPGGTTYIHITGASNGTPTGILQTNGSAGQDTVNIGNGGTFFGFHGDDVIRNDDTGAGYGRLYGGSGHDKMFTFGNGAKAYGGSGNDLIVNSYTYNATMDGGSGNDTLDVSKDFGSPTFNMISGTMGAFGTATNFENFIGVNDAAFYDTVYGTNGNNNISGLGGNDVLFGQGGDDTILGGKGNDTIRGGDDNDVLKGGTGDDDISGDKGNDALFGGSNDDILRGGNGKDELRGDKGNDSLIGGNSKDTFMFGKGFDKDTVRDFADNTDQIALNDNLWKGTLSKTQILNQFANLKSNGDVVFNFGNGDTFKIKHVGSIEVLKNDLVII